MSPGFGVALQPIKCCTALSASYRHPVGVLPGIARFSRFAAASGDAVGTPESGIIMMGALLRLDVWRIDHVDPGQHSGEPPRGDCIDGHQMAKQGRAGRPRHSALGSFIAGTFSLVALMLIAPYSPTSRSVRAGRIFQPDGSGAGVLTFLTQIYGQGAC